jgi:alpha-tubulin suppressor-like RCC1 family protein
MGTGASTGKPLPELIAKLQEAKQRAKDRGKLGHHYIPPQPCSPPVVAPPAAASKPAPLKPGNHFAQFEAQLGDLFNERWLLAPLYDFYHAADSVSAGQGHSLLLREGRVYSWGDNNKGQLGRTVAHYITAHIIPWPVDLPGGFVCKAIAAKGYHSLALSTDGQVYSWGSNSKGALGRPFADDAGFYTPSRTPRPVDLPGGFICKAIAVGFNHCLALSTDRQVYSWGSNSQGALGRPVADDAGFDATPRRVDLPVACSAIAAGTHYCFALGIDGRVYSWGDNERSQLGRPVAGDAGFDTTPRPVDLPVACRAIAAGTHHCFALGIDGQVYSWGWNGDGQLGRTVADDAGFDTTPRRVDLPVACKAIAAGTHHCLALGIDDQLYSWGKKNNGQLGRPVADDAGFDATPRPVDLPKGFVCKAIAAEHHSLALGIDSHVYSWGANQYGQLGRDGDEAKPTIIKRLLALTRPALPPSAEAASAATGG